MLNKTVALDLFEIMETVFSPISHNSFTYRNKSYYMELKMMGLDGYNTSDIDMILDSKILFVSDIVIEAVMSICETIGGDNTSDKYNLDLISEFLFSRNYSFSEKILSKVIGEGLVNSNILRIHFSDLSHLHLCIRRLNYGFEYCGKVYQSDAPITKFIKEFALVHESYIINNMNMGEVV